MQNVKLNNGVEMPILGLGVYQMSEQECEQSVLDAIMAGYRSIDTAAAYENEEAVGRAIKKSGVHRDQLFIATKLWIKDAGYESTKQAFEKSLKKLDLDYLDLYLIHQPFGDIFGSWQAMEELYKEGKIRAIGVSNFYPDRLMDLMLHSEIIPAINQIETHPYFQRADYQQFMKEYNVQIESWSPFGQNTGVLDNELLKDIALKHYKSVAQIILRWLVQRNVVVIPKSKSKERIIENISVFDFELTDEDMAAIATLDTGKSPIFDHHDPASVKMLCEAEFNI